MVQFSLPAFPCFIIRSRINHFLRFTFLSLLPSYFLLFVFSYTMQLSIFFGSAYVGNSVHILRNKGNSNRPSDLRRYGGLKRTRTTNELAYVRSHFRPEA